MSDVALLNKVNINKIREVIYNNIIRKLIHGEEKFTIINGGEFTYNEGDQLYSVTVNTPEDNVTLSEEIKDDPECTKSLLQIRIVDALIEGDDWELFLHDSRITMHYIQWVLPTILH